jgi:hypothetical protein
MLSLNTLHTVALWVAILGLAAWGFATVFAPEQAHPLSNSLPMNAATTATLGAALIALAVVFVFMAIPALADFMLTAGIALLILVLMRAYLMFITDTVPINGLMVLTLVVALFAALILCTRAVAKPTPTQKK